MHDVKTMIAPMAEIRELERFLIDHGREQAGRPVPTGWGRRRNKKPHGCYASAQRWMRDPSVTYTEGVAVSAGLVGHPIAHAWLTGPDGGVIDLAWEVPGAVYLGVQIPDRIASAAFVRTSAAMGGWVGELLPEVIRSGWTPGDDA
ncbi:hypothetical protein FSW04_17705 [Baekduia soli]|uniref:Uncharacterized protein n=1 Tax=Baekduia soli TaxID=496014 RepID=A0A5B8U840_9ACTN|nr:hypothetical protein [Baekduia soli]QEC49234.1 hypothetical protein FSW04_17705 [Baekduia soli]